MKYFFYASGVFFLLVGALVVITFTQKRAPEVRQQKIELQKEQLSTPPINGPQIRIVDPSDGGDFVTVEYRDNGFTPKSVTLKQNESGLGCLLKIVNKSSKELLLRLSPYDPEGRRGFSFSPAAPGESIKIDPRHGSLNPLSFHNRHDPTKEFTVTLDRNCFAY